MFCKHEEITDIKSNKKIVIQNVNPKNNLGLAEQLPIVYSYIFWLFTVYRYIWHSPRKEKDVEF